MLQRNNETKFALKPNETLAQANLQRVAVRKFPASRARPPGRLTATASEPYVSACACVCWTRAARGCALSPLAAEFPRSLAAGR